MKRFLSLLLVMLFGLGAAPQRGVTVSGVTEDQTGAAIPDQNLTLTHKMTGAVRKTVSDSSGHFSFKDAGPGVYSLKAEAEGFKPSTLSITVGQDPMPEIRIKMEVSISDEVTINSKQSEAVSPENNAGSVYLNSDSLNSLPSQGQNVLTVINNFLTPAAQGADGPSVVVDGAESNDLNLPTAALKQVHINKNPYSAEYRRPGSSRVEVVTRYGSRAHFDGSLAFYERNSVFDARNAFALTKPDLNRKLFEGSLSGPLPFRRTRFFLSGSRLSSNESVVVNALTPGSLLIENVPTSLYNTNLLGRIDVRPNDSNTVILLYSFYDQPERNNGVGGLHLAEQGISRDKRGHKMQVSHSRIFSESFLNVARLTFNKKFDHIGNPASEPAIQVKGAFFGGPSQTARLNQ